MEENTPRERNPTRDHENPIKILENPWLTIKRRKSKPPNHQASRTCFVNHLPPSITIPEIARIFRTHGAIAEITIPKTQNQTSHKFAFVQFHYPQSLTTAIRDENKRKVETMVISVHPAKYDKNLYARANNPPTTLTYSSRVANTKQISQNPKKAYTRDLRTYKEAANPTKTTENKKTNHPQTRPPKPTPILQFHNPNNPVLPFEEYVPTTTSCRPEPSAHRKMSSRALGEDTEKIRSTLGAIDMESDFAAALKGKRCKENEDMLQRSSIAFSPSSQSSEIIMDHILAEGVNCLTIRPMGGMLHLLTFDTFENKKAMIESGWLQRWFSKIINVNTRSASLWRETWVNIYGVPLIAWGYESFYNIGSMLGRVLSVNYKDFDCARVLLFTDCFFDISCKISFEIEDEKYPVFISEKQQLWQNKTSPEYKISKINDANDGNPLGTIKDAKGPDDDESPVILMQPTSGKPTPMVVNVSDNEKTESHFLKNDELIINVKIPENTSLLGNDDAPAGNKKSDKTTDEVPCTEKIVDNDDVQYPSNVKLTPSKNGARDLENKKKSQPSNDFNIIETNKTSIQNPPGPSPELGLISCNASSPPIPIQSIHQTSPTQPHSSPPTSPLSPIHLTNRFKALVRPSSSMSSSSSLSGPLFPPGFENDIPLTIKAIHKKKREKKIQKKKKPPFLPLPNQSSPSLTRALIPSSSENSVSSILEVGKKLGMRFNGPETILEERIESILQQHKASWKANQN